MALVVAYAASDGTIFGLNSNSVQGSYTTVNNSNTGGAVISSDTFDEVSQFVDSNSPPETNVTLSEEATLSEEERRLLAMSDFPWDSVAEHYIISNQDAMDPSRRPMPAQAREESLALSDDIDIDLQRVRDTNWARIGLELADSIDIDIPVDLTEVAEELGEEFPDIDEPQDNEDRGKDAGSSNQNGDMDDSESSDDEESGDEEGSADSGPGRDDKSRYDNDETGVGNSTDTEDPSTDSDGGSSDTGDNSTDTKGAESMS
jgi:hypothetical protein